MSLLVPTDAPQSHHKIESELEQINWWRLVPGIILTGALALSVHVVLLDVLKIPYPSQVPKTGVVAFLNYAVSVLALFGFYDLASPWFFRLSPVWRSLGLSLLLIMLNEVFRVMFIEAMITTAWAYSFVNNVQRIFPLLLIGCLVAMAAPKLTRFWQKATAAVLIAGLTFFGFRPLLTEKFKHLLSAIDYLSHDQIYSDTSWQLNTVAYIGYVEPTLASFIMAALVWPRLSARPGWRAVQFALLIVLIRGLFFVMFYYPFYAHLSVPLAMLSAGQFTLEWLTLGLLTAMTWQLCQRRVAHASTLS